MENLVWSLPAGDNDDRRRAELPKLSRINSVGHNRRRRFPPERNVATAGRDCSAGFGGRKGPRAARETSPSGHRLGLASLTDGTVPPLPLQLPPLSSSRAKQPG